jgi:putative NADH-flavin reductase
MKIAVLGANGRIGQAVVQEALMRGHRATAAIRSPRKMPPLGRGLSIVETNVVNAGSIATAIEGHDAVVSALGGMDHDNPRIVAESCPAVVEAMTATKVPRLLVMGVAGTLRARDGVEIMDQPDFPSMLVPEGTAHRELEMFLRGLPYGPIEWTYFSPPWDIWPGERTGSYRLGRDDMLYDDDGRSYISIEDAAVAALDELEQPRHVGLRFTAASASVAPAQA